MIRIQVDSDTRDKLNDLCETAEICDDQGRVLGEFHPAIVPVTYAGVDSPLTEDELRRREEESETFSTVEVMQRLKEL